MITKPTVLILGAGASAPYGFPMGEKLWELICDGLKTGGLHDFLLQNGFDNDKILSFRKNLFECGKTSVDAFLEHRTEFLNIGKLSIAYILTSFEESDVLYNAGEGKWYKYLFDKMNSNNFEEFGKNKISIITYNYDRSIEFFLFNSLQRSYGENELECKKIMVKISIIHLHGKLGFLPWQDKNGRPYCKANSEEIKISAKNIKIIHENIENDPEFEKAHSELEKAERIYVLGFGYNDINVKRIGITDLSEGKIIIGTAMGLEKKELENKKRICNGKVSMPDDFRDSLNFLKEYADFD